jgi:predicted hydrolase (HD superfamily)
MCLIGFWFCDIGSQGGITHMLTTYCIRMRIVARAFSSVRQRNKFIEKLHDMNYDDTKLVISEKKKPPQRILCESTGTV